MWLSVISFFIGFWVFSSLFARYIFLIVSYAIEQLLSCRVKWHPRPIPALGMSQQGKGDILTSGSAWISYVGTSIVIEDLNNCLWFGNTTCLLTHCFCKLASSILAMGFVQLFQQGSKKRQHWILRRNCASESRNFLAKGFMWGQPRVDRWRLPNLSVGRKFNWCS